MILHLFSFFTAAVPDLSIPCNGDFNSAQTVPVSSGLTHIAMPHNVNDSTSCFVNMSVPAGHLPQFTVQDYSNSVITSLWLPSCSRISICITVLLLSFMTHIWWKLLFFFSGLTGWGFSPGKMMNISLTMTSTLGTNLSMKIACQVASHFLLTLMVMLQWTPFLIHWPVLGNSGILLQPFLLQVNWFNHLW